jgi:hypothetical protein
MSALSDIVGRLEGGSDYGQKAGFVAQYGSGVSGVHSYANQVLAANPNATLGDFYSGYVLGTGNPAATPGIGALQNPAAYGYSPAVVQGAQGAYNNLVNNAGVPHSTSLASLLNGAAGSGTSTTPGDTLTLDPNQPGSVSGPAPVTVNPGYWTDFSGGEPGPGGISIGPYNSAEGLFGPSAPGTSSTGGLIGTGSTSATGSGNIFPALGFDIADFAARGALVLLAIVLIAAAAWGLVHGEQARATA